MGNHRAIGRRFQQRVAVTAIGLASLVPIAGYADLIEYQFTTPSGEARTLAADAQFANPVGPINFKVSGGVDRRVSVSLLREDGSEIQSQTSQLLGAEDRIKTSDGEYYGALLTLNGVGEGNYQIRSRILSSAGSIVSESNNPLLIDTTPPTVGEFTMEGTGVSRASDGRYIFSHHEPRLIALSNVGDARSGIDNARFETYRASGNIVLNGEVTYFPSDNKAQLGTGGNSSVTTAHVPSALTEQNRIRYIIRDKAGNSAYKDLTFYNSSSCGPLPEPVAYHDPSYSGSYMGLSKFKNLRPVNASGNHVSSNPVKVLYRVPRTAYRGLPEGAIYGGYPDGFQYTLDHTDSSYAYFAISGPLALDGTINYPSYGWTTPATWRCGALGLPNPSFTSNSTPPQATNVEAYINGVGWVDKLYSANLSTPRAPRNTAITKFRYSAQPRSYTQQATVLGASCTIPAGGTSCIGNLNHSFNTTGTASHYHERPVVRHTGNPALFSSFNHYIWEWDAIEPSITKLLSLDRDRKRIVFEGYKAFSGRTWNRVRIAKGGVIAVDGQGVRHTLSANSIEMNGDYSSITTDYGSLPEGNYQLIGWVEDYNRNRGEKSLGNIYNDTSPPAIDIISAQEDEISTLDSLSIRLKDDISVESNIISVSLVGGPTKEIVHLSTRRTNTNQHSLEYPIIFPSLQAGEEYTLIVVAEDDQHNRATQDFTFAYNPPQVSLQGGFIGNLLIPAAPNEFRHADGRRIIETEPLTLADGSIVAGTYDVFASVRSDSNVPLIVNGVRIDPGTTNRIMSQHDFSQSGGKLSLSLSAAEYGLLGVSNLLVSTSAPNAPVLLQDVETWKASGELSGSNWEPRQVIDPLSYIARPTSSTYCQFTTRESESRLADAINSPVCFVEWDRLPGELTPVEHEKSEDAVPEITGLATDQGQQLISFSIYMFDNQGAKVKVGEGSRSINVVSALNSIEYGSKEDYSSVNRVLHDFDLRLEQRSGPECLLTLTEGVARQAAQRNGYDSSRRTCYFEWSQVPDGLNQNPGPDTPQLMGNISSAGEHTLSWKAYTFSPGGYRVPVAQQNETITMVEPEAPTIELTSDYHHEGSTYIVPQNRNSLGGLIVDALPTDVRLDIKRGAQQVENDVYTAGWGARNRLIRNMRTQATPVWSETVHSVTASYEKLPEIRTVGDYNVVSAPSDGVQPLVTMDSTTVLDTEPLKLAVKMRNMMDRDGEYVESEMGQWQVRLLNQQSYSNLEPMTELFATENGDVDFEVEMEKLTDAGLRIVAEAHLVSPIEGYERVVTSRPTFVQVLRGGAIDGEVTSRRFSGPAPLTAVFQISLEDRLDQQALGEVVWQVSTDDGATWEDQPIDPRRKTQFYHAFDEGEYLLRAFLVNGNSGAESYTEQVQIVSYAQPDVQINGPTVLFVGDTHTYTANITVPKNAVKSADDAIVDWSLDGGDTWTHTGRELELTSDTEQRFAIRARTRMPEAPELDRDAFNEARIMVNFRDVVAPRVRVRSKTLLEEGNAYEISVSASAPYRGMEYEIKGYFTLPDGSTREGNVIEYVPTIADADAGSATFTYTAWVEGFKEETTATDSSTSRVWQYVWPEFYFTERVSTSVAPAQVSLSLRHRDGARTLDNPTYEWELPDGIEELQERGGTTRLFQITEPGTHRVAVNIKDERGHESLLEHVVVLGEPDPFDITLRYTPSNNFMREPLDVRLRPTYRGGHPHDRVNTQRFLVNGEVISEGANSGIATLNAGRHEVVFEIESNHGVKDQGSIIIDVLENQVPICELESSESSRNWIVRASCEDVDGRVSNYHWMVDGEEYARTSNRLGILKRDYDDVMPSVVLIAVDDSGGASDPVSLP